MIDKKTKKEIIEKFAKKENDTGSVEIQIALLTNRINSLTEHLKIHKKDKSSYKGLLKMVGKRKSFLKYISNKDINKYRDLIKKLGLRK